MHSPDVPPSEHENLSPTGSDDSLWAFLPILVGLAAICLLTFFFISPSFEAVDPIGAKSARPGAATSVTGASPNFGRGGQSR